MIGFETPKIDDTVKYQSCRTMAICHKSLQYPKFNICYKIDPCCFEQPKSLFWRQNIGKCWNYYSWSTCFEKLWWKVESSKYYDEIWHPSNMVNVNKPFRTTQSIYVWYFRRILAFKIFLPFNLLLFEIHRINFKFVSSNYLLFITRTQVGCTTDDLKQRNIKLVLYIFLNRSWNTIVG